METQELQKKRMSVIGQISAIMADSGRPKDTLQKIVEIIAGKFNSVEEVRKITRLVDTP